MTYDHVEYKKTINELADQLVAMISWDMTYSTGYGGAINDYLHDVHYDLKQAILEKQKEGRK